MTQPTPIPGEAIEAAVEAARQRAAQLHNLLPDDFDMTAFRELLEAAAPFLVEAGREQAMAGAEEQWAVLVGSNRSAVEHASEEAARERLAMYRDVWGDLAVVAHRHVTEWAEAEQGGQG